MTWVVSTGLAKHYINANILSWKLKIRSDTTWDSHMLSIAKNYIYYITTKKKTLPALDT